MVYLKIVGVVNGNELIYFLGEMNIMNLKNNFKYKLIVLVSIF